jgi:hypothetical protein
LEGSPRAKERLEVILQTIVGELTIAEATNCLGISEPRFYQLRTAVLEAGLSCLEPRAPGRPPQAADPAAAEVQDLMQQMERLDRELTTSEIRLDLARALPHLLQEAPVKKTTDRKRLRRRLKNKQNKRRGKPR